MGSGGIFGVGLGKGVAEDLLPARGAHRHDAREHRRGARPRRRHGASSSPTRSSRTPGFRIALGCRDPFGKRLAVGLTVLVCGQAAVNIAAVMGVAPLTGIPLPFLSYGGSSLVVLLASVGILLNIAASWQRRDSFGA